MHATLSFICGADGFLGGHSEILSSPTKGLHLSPLLLASGSGSGSGSSSRREFPSSRGDTGVCHCHNTVCHNTVSLDAQRGMRASWLVLCFALLCSVLCSLRVSPARIKDRAAQQSPSHITEPSDVFSRSQQTAAAYERESMPANGFLQCVHAPFWFTACFGATCPRHFKGRANESLSCA